MPDDGGRISFAGLKFENLPKSVMAMVVVLVAVAAIGFYGYEKWRDPELISARQASANLQAAVDEYGLHISEPPEATAVLLDDVRGQLKVARYGDGCLALTRSRNGRVRSRLIVDLDRDEHKTVSVSSRPERFADALVEIVADVVEASARCLNPHPGKFDTWYGERRDCWVQVWRRWPDGCQHVQWFDSCHGQWATNQDGTPQVKWTACVH